MTNSQENRNEPFLEIQGSDGKVSHFPLKGRRFIIGRAEDAELRLQHDAVSRHHAELICDPFGRWWIRDMKSHNGIRINGVQVAESMLQSGSVFKIAVFSIKFHAAALSLRQTVALPVSAISIEDEIPCSTTTITEMESPKIGASHLDKLTEFSQQLIDTEDSGERLRLLCLWMLGSELHGRFTMALRLSKERPDDPPEALCEAEIHPEYQGQPLHISRTLMQRIRKVDVPVLATNTSSKTFDVKLSMSPDSMTAAAVACPLRSDDRIIDVLYVMLPAEYGTGAWLALVSLAVKQYQQAESAWAARIKAQDQALIEQELERARELQMRLIPSDPMVEGLDVTISFRPCRWVGGDYVDVATTSDGRTLLLIADVCGKGLQAALVTASIHTVIHTSLRSRLGLTDMMLGLNEEMCDMLPEQSFVTMVSVLLDPRTGELECINAGHPPPFVLDQNGEPRKLQSCANLPLGLFPQELQSARDKIDPGHLLTLYTDGLTELTDSKGEMLGLEGLAEHLKKICRSGKSITADRVSERLNELIHEIQGDRLPDDDQTFLVARYLAL